VGTISLIDFVPPPLDPIPADITGLAPIVSTVDTWYAAPVSTDPEISIGGGGMLRDLVYEDRIALH
jgi:hypothetical protein